MRLNEVQQIFNVAQNRKIWLKENTGYFFSPWLIRQ